MGFFAILILGTIIIGGVLTEKVSDNQVLKTQKERATRDNESFRTQAVAQLKTLQNNLSEKKKLIKSLRLEVTTNTTAAATNTQKNRQLRELETMEKEHKILLNEDAGPLSIKDAGEMYYKWRTKKYSIQRRIRDIKGEISKMPIVPIIIPRVVDMS
jgi:hypothetical protein